jgi:hypothetical protein
MSGRDSWLKRARWIRRKLNAWLMLKLESVALIGKENDQRNWIENTWRSLPRESGSFFPDVRLPEKCK